MERHGKGEHGERHGREDEIRHLGEIMFCCDGDNICSCGASN